MISKDYEVAKIGWNDENPSVPVVLIDGNERTRLNLSSGDVVKVIHKLNDMVELQSLAYVSTQFREYINKEVASLNNKLGELLQVQVGSKVRITKEITESEVERFQLENKELSMSHRWRR